MVYYYVLTNELIHEVESLWDNLEDLAYHLSHYRIQGSIREPLPCAKTLVDGTRLIGKGGQLRKVTYMKVQQHD